MLKKLIHSRMVLCQMAGRMKSSGLFNHSTNLPLGESKKAAKKTTVKIPRITDCLGKAGVRPNKVRRVTIAIVKRPMPKKESATLTWLSKSSTGNNPTSEQEKAAIKAVTPIKFRKGPLKPSVIPCEKTIKNSPPMMSPPLNTQYNSLLFVWPSSEMK